MSDQPDERAALRKLLEDNAALAEELAEYRRFAGSVADIARDLGLENVHYDPRTVARPVLPGRYAIGHSTTYDIVCFSIIDWEFRWQRPQQIMSRFADEGHRVFFISISRYLPPSGQRCAVKELRQNVWEVQLALADRLDVYGTEIGRELVNVLMDDLRALRNTFDIVCAVSFVQLATWAALAYAAREEFGWRVVYDCMDEWDSFPGMSHALLAAERRLLRDGDLLVVTGKKLQEKYSALNANTVLARNGADFERFRKGERQGVLENVSRPIAGYFGAIADWFDTELLLRAAIERPSYSFVLVGGVFDVDIRSLESVGNVHLLGQQPYEMMPSYLAAFDVCIIPFRINPITEATDPVKFYEYVSQGKPVVATRMHELETYSDLLYLADDAADFISKLDVAVRERDPELAEKRIALARTNTWEARLRTIKEGIVKAHPPASIVIVTFGNLEVTRQCLQSVLTNTLYPNLEVIVVDNGSTDGTPDYLRELSAAHSSVRIILNPGNRGFAAANNQGLAAARGEYLVLLNNDTVVPPGWLTRLIRHLERPEIGLVNAVTNFSGNESRVDVPYTDISDMPEFARARGRDFDGEFFDIRVAAMYCVGMRRDAFERIGPLDEKFGIGMFEDDDYSHRARIAGYRVVCAEDAFVHHHGQASFKKLTPEEYQKIWDVNQAWYEKKWKTRWKAHLPRSWKRKLPSLPGRLEVEMFFTKLAKAHELEESEKARYLEGIHLRDEIAAREIHIDDLKRELYLLQTAYETIVRSRAWKGVQIFWSVMNKIRPRKGPKPVVREEPKEVPLAADAFAPDPAKVAPPGAEAPAVISSLAPLQDERAIDIVVLPMLEWGFRFQRPQQLASQLARAGHRVFYVSHRMRQEGPPYERREVREGVHEVSLRGPVRDVFLQSLTRSDVEGLLEMFAVLEREQQLAATAVIAQLPFWSPLALGMRQRFAWPVAYDCMDLHSAFATAPRQLAEQESELIRSADLVSVSSAFLFEEIRHQSANVVLLRNGCDYDLFSSAAKRGSPHQREKSRPLIGYYGAVAEWFDVELVASLARKRPDWDFVIVGSTAAAEVSALRRLRNVSLAGERPYGEIPGWLERFDVAIIPFRITPLTRATNPVKAYEMLAGGKPVVSTPLPEMSAMAPLVRIASTVDEFEKQIEEALVFDYEPVMVEKRQSFARENTWATRARTLIEGISGLFRRVLIVADGALSTDEALRAEYPNATIQASVGSDTGRFKEIVRAADPDVVIVAGAGDLPFGRGEIATALRELEESAIAVPIRNGWAFRRETVDHMKQAPSVVDAITAMVKASSTG